MLYTERFRRAVAKIGKVYFKVKSHVALMNGLAIVAVGCRK